MAHSIPFKEVNVHLGIGTSGADYELQIHSGPVVLASGKESNMMTSCWRFTRPELEEIQRTGCCWLSMLGSAHPPVAVTATKPALGGG